MVNRYAVGLRAGPFDGLVVEVVGCCSAPWVLFVARADDGPRAWHPEEVPEAPVGAAQYMRDGVPRWAGLYTATYVPWADPLAETA